MYSSIRMWVTLLCMEVVEMLMSLYMTLQEVGVVMSYWNMTVQGGQDVDALAWLCRVGVW